MIAQHMQTEKRSFSSFMFHKALHKPIFQTQGLCLEENHHKQYWGRTAKAPSGTPHQHPACRRMVQIKLSWEGLTSLVMCVWWLKESLVPCLCSRLHTQKRCVRARKGDVIIWVGIFLCLFGPMQ